MATHDTIEVRRDGGVPLARIPQQRCPSLGRLPCQRTDDHERGHVYHGAWAPDRHDLQD